MSGKNVAVALLVVSLFMICDCRSQESSPQSGGPSTAPAPTVPTKAASGTLNAKRGIGFWPSDYSAGYIQQCVSFLKQGAEIAYGQKQDPFDRPENRYRNEAIDAWLDGAGKAGLVKYVALEPFDDERKAVRLPADWHGPKPTLGDAQWRAAYQQKVLDVVRRHQPEYLNIAVEANMYYRHHPEDWEAFRSLFRSVRDAVKQISPGTKVFCSYQYELLWGQLAGQKSAPQWELLRDKAVDGDLIGISTYPLLMTSPYDSSRVPDDYFQALAPLAKQPVFVAEMGWYSSDEVKPSSSAANQAEFVSRLPRLFSGLNVEGLCWISLCDLKHLPALKALEKTLPQFFSLALLDSEFHPKPAWETWKSLRAGSGAP